jgi:multiple sugar transport system substrate-binding protein
MFLNRMLMTIMLLLIAFTLSACNETKKLEPVEIHYQIYHTKNLDGFFSEEKLENAAANFHKLNPQITVTIDYLESLELMYSTHNDINLLESDKPQDITPFDLSKIPLAEKKGLLLDLIKFQSSSDARNIDINPNILDTFTVNGKLFMLPYVAYPKVIFYNKAFFDAAHIPYPQDGWTWEQFREISKKIKPKSGYGSELRYDPYTLDVLMGSTGKRMLSPNGDTSVGYLDSPEAISKIEWLNAYYKDDELKSGPISGLTASFETEQIGMILNATSVSQFYASLQDRLGIASLPHFEGGKRANLIGFSGFAISQKSKHPQEAWKFIEYLTLTKNEDSVQFSNGGILTSSSVAEAAGQSSDPSKSVALDEMNYVVKSSSDYNPLFYQAWNKDLMSQFQELHTTDDKDIPFKLHELAIKLDKELNRLKNAADQSAESK